MGSMPKVYELENVRLATENRKVRAENERLREALEWMADAERAETADPLEWATEAHERACGALAQSNER